MARYEEYLKVLGHTTIVPEVVVLKNKTQKLSKELKRQEREYDRLSKEIKRQSDKNIELREIINKKRQESIW